MDEIVVQERTAQGISVLLFVAFPVPVSARAKAWVCGRSPAEIVSSNLTGAWMFVVSVVCCQVEISARS